MLPLASYTTPFLPTPQSLIDAVSAVSGTCRFGLRAELLHSDLSPYSLPVPLNPADPSDVSALCEVSTIDNNATAKDVARSAQFTFHEWDRLSGNIDTLQNHVRLYQQYLGPNDEEWMRVPLGTFRFFLPDRTLADTENTLTVMGQDPTIYLARLHFEYEYDIPPNYPVTAALQALLTADMLPPTEGGRAPTGTVWTGGAFTGGSVTGSGLGYMPEGFAAADPRSGCYPMGVHTDAYQRRATSFPGSPILVYMENNGMKVDGANGNIVDPWTGADMIVATITPSVGAPFPAWVCSRLSGDGHPLYLSTTPTNPPGYLGFVDAVTGIETSPISGNPASGTSETFNLMGGDGGHGDNPVPVTTGGHFAWPDPNNPGLTPSGCPFYGPNYPKSHLHITPSNITTLAPISNRTGTSVLATMNQLAASINYWPLRCTAWGDAVYEPIPWSYVDALGHSIIPTGADWTYSTDDRSVIQGSVSERFNDQQLLGNLFQFLSEHNQADPINIIKLNRSPDSAISLARLGYVLPILLQNDQVSDPTLAEAQAQLGLLMASLAQQGLEVPLATINPFLDIHDLVNLNIYSKDGTVLEVDSTNVIYPFTISAIHYDLTKWEQTLTVARLGAV